MTAEAPPWVPLCMSAKEWATWQRLNPRVVQGGPKSRPCADCPPSYAAAPDYGYCNGTPRGVEKEDDVGDDWPGPGRPKPAKADNANGPAVARRSVDLAVTAPPCPSCVHEPVCGLRRYVEGLATVEAAASALPEGLTLTLSALVECVHFDRARRKPGPKPAELTPEQRGAANRNAQRDSLGRTKTPAYIAARKANLEKALAAKARLAGDRSRGALVAAGASVIPAPEPTA